jgi:hypothetical protein
MNGDITAAAWLVLAILVVALFAVMAVAVAAPH